MTNLRDRDTMPMLDIFTIAERNQRGDISQIVGVRMRRDAAFSREITIEAIDPVVFENSNCKWLCAAGSMDRCL
jgi:hypothetical protein